MIWLIIFDVDGTLAKSHRLDLLPGVKEFFQLVLQGGCEPRLKLAIATNQGGVGIRYGLERKKAYFRENYPTAEAIELRMSRLLTQLGVDGEIPLYIAYRYKDKQGNLSPLPPGKEDDPRWRSDWRKPAPGMLLQAIKDAGVQPDEVMYVGDRSEDRQAAQAAGCVFVDAKEFFARDWQACQDISSIMEKNQTKTNEHTRSNQSSWLRRLIGR